MAIKEAIAAQRADSGILSERELFGRLSTSAMLPTVAEVANVVLFLAASTVCVTLTTGVVAADPYCRLLTEMLFPEDVAV